jgi:hypothetical protein
MNLWTQLSIELANQRNYLDELFYVYPTIPESIRDIDEQMWQNVENAFHNHNNKELIKNLLEFELFPIKDSYVAYLREDKKAIDRNPQTVNRLAGRLYEIGLNKIFERSTEPKETNRQIGHLFKKWIEKGSLGLHVTNSLEEFNDLSNNNIIFNGSDTESKNFAQKYLANQRNYLDLLIRINNKYIIGEAKFLSSFGGNQNNQFQDAISLLDTKVNDNVIKVAILDGITYISGKSQKISIEKYNRNDFIMSALVLRNFIYQV